MNQSTLGGRRRSSGGDYLSNGALASFDYSSFSGWSPNNQGLASVAQITHNGEGVFEYTASAYHSTNLARANKDIVGVSTPNTFTISQRVEFTALGTLSQAALLGAPIDYRFDTGGAMRLYVAFYSDYVNLLNDSGNELVAYATPIGRPFWLSCKVTWVSGTSASVDIAADGVLIATGLDGHKAIGATSDGRIESAGVDRLDDAIQDSMYISNLLIGNDWNS